MQDQKPFAIIEDNGAMRCANPSCGRILTKNMTFCPHCSTTPKRQTKACPLCGEEILAVAVKCKHCGSHVPRQGQKPRAKDGGWHGAALLGIPVGASFLVWYYVGKMALIQSPGSTLGLIAVSTVILTAAVAAMEASELGMVSDRKGSYSPTAWFFLISLLWVVCYPAYLYKRRHYGRPSYLIVGLLVTLIFISSVALMDGAIGYRMAEIRAVLAR